MLDFPANPTPGQQFTAAGVTWTFDGTKWTASGLGVAYLPLAGGTMLGPIVLAADPTAALQPATKQYVDGGRLGDNRLVNGDMRIDQRNNGASGTAAGYTIDRWSCGTSVASKGTWGRLNATSCPGFPYALSFTSSSAYAVVAADYFVFQQPIEADMVSDFAWGSANAQPVTLSFWALSSLTGAFGGSIQNYGANSRSYPFSFNLPTANTWTKVITTIPGDTAGTWVMTGNGGALLLTFSLGMGSNRCAAAGAWAAGNFLSFPGAVSVVGTNAAQFILTGVKLEVGIVATPFNRQSLAKSLADCERYFQVYPYTVWSHNASAAGQAFYTSVQLATSMRAVPSLTVTGQAYNNASGITSVGSGLNNSLALAAAATAAGWATASCGLTFSAEL